MQQSQEWGKHDILDLGHLRGVSRFIVHFSFCSVQLAQCCRVTLNIYCNWQNTFADNSTKLPSRKHIEEDINLRQAQMCGQMASYITLPLLYEDCLS